MNLCAFNRKETTRLLTCQQALLENMGAVAVNKFTA